MKRSDEGNVLARVQRATSREPVFTQIIGNARESIVLSVMRRMRREGKIQFFTKTRKFSYADVIKGIDFYLVVRTPTQLQTFTVDVTGPTGTGNRPQQVSKLAVDLRLPRSELEANIEAQILDMIHPRTLS